MGTCNQYDVILCNVNPSKLGHRGTLEQWNKYGVRDYGISTRTPDMALSILNMASPWRSTAQIRALFVNFRIFRILNHLRHPSLTSTVWQYGCIWPPNFMVFHTYEDKNCKLGCYFLWQNFMTSAAGSHCSGIKLREHSAASEGRTPLVQNHVPKFSWWII